MQHIETVTLDSAEASITFSAIPATFTDLYLLISCRGTDGLLSGTIIFNGSGGTYTRRRLLGNGSSASSASPTSDFIFSESGHTANTFGNASIYIPNYRSSSAKSYSVDSVSENNATESYQGLFAGLWSGTDAITSVTLGRSQGLWATHSSASLYGILAGSDGTTVVS